MITHDNIPLLFLGTLTIWKRGWNPEAFQGMFDAC